MSFLLIIISLKIIIFFNVTFKTRHPNIYKIYKKPRRLKRNKYTQKSASDKYSSLTKHNANCLNKIINVKLKAETD